MQLLRRTRVIKAVTVVVLLLLLGNLALVLEYGFSWVAVLNMVANVCVLVSLAATLRWRKRHEQDSVDGTA